MNLDTKGSKKTRLLLKISKKIDIDTTFLYHLEFDISTTNQNFVLNHEGLNGNNDRNISDIFKNHGIEIYFKDDEVISSNKFN
jgi:hypothetical protein